MKMLADNILLRCISIEYICRHRINFVASKYDFQQRSYESRRIIAVESAGFDCTAGV